MSGLLDANTANDACENDVLATLAAFPGRAFNPEQICGLLRNKGYSQEDVEAALIELDRRKLIAMAMVPIATVTAEGSAIASARSRRARKSWIQASQNGEAERSTRDDA